MVYKKVVIVSFHVGLKLILFLKIQENVKLVVKTTMRKYFRNQRVRINCYHCGLIRHANEFKFER